MGLVGVYTGKAYVSAWKLYFMSCCRTDADSIVAILLALVSFPLGFSSAIGWNRLAGGVPWVALNRRALCNTVRSTANHALAVSH